MTDKNRTDQPRWAIEAEKLTKSFDDRLALRGVDLKIAPGESVVVFGPNGAGKTTLIKLLATIMSPSSGKIMIDGLDIKKEAEQVRRKIGVVSHNTYLYGNLTAYENLDFYRRLYDVPKGRIAEVAAMVGMDSRLHDRVSTLSSGMRQRFSIARALLHNPAIILLDEPETGLDQEAISLLWTVLRRDAPLYGKVFAGRLRRQSQRDLAQPRSPAKRTVILTTHNLAWGLELADRLFILSRGRIVFEGTKPLLDLEGLKRAYIENTGVAA